MDNNINNDAVAARRRALAEALRTGEPVVVTASGEVEKRTMRQIKAYPAFKFLTENWHKEGTQWPITGIKVTRNFIKWRLRQ